MTIVAFIYCYRLAPRLSSLIIYSQMLTDWHPYIDNLANSLPTGEMMRVDFIGIVRITHHPLYLGPDFGSLVIMHEMHERIDLGGKTITHRPDCVC